MKKVLATLLAVLLLTCVFGTVAMAATTVPGNNTHYTVDGDKAGIANSSDAVLKYVKDNYKIVTSTKVYLC
ncbi:MAG: hypothetical protein PUK86_08710, partial [bacterium]|nr:hypothetical protein [bacterium]